MATTSLSIPLSPLPLSSSILHPKPRFSLNTHNSSLSLTSSTVSSKRALPLISPPPLKSAQIWKISAVSGDALPLEANPVENFEKITVSSGDDGVSIIISVLLFIAFAGLSILTIGVIYIAVTDFLQKREADKFVKEEAAKEKKRSKRKKARGRR